MQSNKPPDERILIFAPRGRDAEVISQVLSDEYFHCTIAPDLDSLISGMRSDASAAVMTEEVLQDTSMGLLLDWIGAQEPWSDFPFILLVPKVLSPSAPTANGRWKALGNLILLEKPLNSPTLIRAAASALRARRRQCQARDVLQMREKSEADLRESQQALRRLNETLEQRIHERTADLAQANDRLMNEMAERERIQQSLIQTQKMEAVGQLTGGLAHDFNNLLSVIQGNMDLISMLSVDQRVLAKATIARNAAQRGARLTGQLLAFSRTQQLDLKPTDLRKILGGVKELIASSVGSNIQVTFDVDSDFPPVIADENQIELAVLNLAINARDAMQGGGALVIRAEIREGEGNLSPDQRFGVVQVSDTGTGINPAILGKVFDPFFTTKGLGKGTGLGLSQVYGIAQQSGGSVTISSEVGIGTTVAIWLRLADKAQVAALRDADPAHLVSPHARAKVLVVEDEPDVRQFMVESLEVLGYSVVEAPNGEAGYQKLLHEAPDVLITDFLMPGMTGAELVKKAVAKFPTLPVIIATGYADTAALEKTIEGSPVLRKPFRVNDLARSVQQALARNSSSRSPSSITSQGREGS